MIYQICYRPAVKLQEIRGSQELTTNLTKTKSVISKSVKMPFLSYGRKLLLDFYFALLPEGIIEQIRTTNSSYSGFVYLKQRVKIPNSFC